MQWRLIERRDLLSHAVTAANQQHRHRRRIFVELSDAGTVGWGEVSPLEETVLGDPSFDDVYSELAHVALLNVSTIWSREGVAPRWSRVAALARNSAPSRWAHAAIEMAILDWELQRSNVSLAEQWETNVMNVHEMNTVSLLDPPSSWHVSDRARRLRVKTSFGVDVNQSFEALGALSLPVLLDFNASARSSDEVLRQLVAFDTHVEVVAVEQPFAPGDLISHAQLAQLSPVAVSLDESVRSVLDVRRIARYEAASLVCVKPARVGGVAVARSMLETATALGLRTYVGGFFESPLARHTHRTLAALVSAEPSDVGSSELDSESPYSQRPTGIGHFPVLSEQEVQAAVHVS